MESNRSINLVFLFVEPAVFQLEEMSERGESEWKGVLLYKLIHSKLQRGNMKGKRVKMIKFMDEEDEKEVRKNK